MRRPASARASRSSRPVARTPAAEPAEDGERALNASPKEVSYAEKAVADAQRRQAWLSKQQEVSCKHLDKDQLGLDVQPVR